MARFGALWQLSRDQHNRIGRVAIRDAGVSERLGLPVWDIDCYDAHGALLFTIVGFPTRQYAIEHCHDHGLGLGRVAVCTSPVCVMGGGCAYDPCHAARRTDERPRDAARAGGGEGG